MKMITGLTKANIKGTGIELAPEHDFTDDGNRFRGFIYKGMVMTQCRADGMCYLAIRVDYLDNAFTFKEWMNTEEYMLEDEFNGVSQFDLDKLIENLEKIIAKVNEMNEAASKEEIDMTEVIAKANDEIKFLETFLNFAKSNIKWWELNKWDLQSTGDAMKSLISRLDAAKSIDFNALERVQKMKYIESLRDSHYVVINEKGYYIEKINEACKR